MARGVEMVSMFKQVTYSRAFSIASARVFSKESSNEFLFYAIYITYAGVENSCIEFG